MCEKEINLARKVGLDLEFIEWRNTIVTQQYVRTTEYPISLLCKMVTVFGQQVTYLNRMENKCSAWGVCVRLQMQLVRIYTY